MTFNQSLTEGGGSKANIAFFDFDGTLVRGDSLWPFLLAVAGWRRCCFAVCWGLFSLFTSWGKGGDRRTVVKAVLLEKTLKGRRVAALAPALEALRRWPRWIEGMEALRRHAAAGHHIVIATGSLDLYLPTLLTGVPYHALLATEMDVVDGVLTGKMGPKGNCVRENKAHRVAEYLAAFGEVQESWAYGNAPHDLPMMALTSHSKIIG